MMRRCSFDDECGIWLALGVADNEKMGLLAHAYISD